MPTNDRRQLRRLPAAQRGRAVPRPGGQVRPARGLPLPRGRRLEVGHLEAGRRRRQPARRRAARARASQPEQRVGIASGTRYEWILADLAIMCAGGATTTVYPSTNDEDTAYILSDSECQVVFAEDDEQIAKLTARKAELPHRRTRSSPSTAPPTATGSSASTTLAKLGDDVPRRAPRRHRGDRRGASSRDQLATLIYTSGTTGRPKGVRLRAPLVGLRGRGDPGAGHPRRGRPAVPAGCRWRTRSARCCCRPSWRAASPTAIDGRVDKIIDNLGRREADVHGRRAAHLREGARPDRHDAGGRGRAQGEDLQPGLQGRPRGRPAQARGQVRPAAAEAPARALRQAGLLARSATASAAGCASSSPARRRSTATSPSGSTPPAS